jgi:hypothetical protein
MAVQGVVLFEYQREGAMQIWRNAAWAGIVVAALLGWPAAASAAGPCDEADPHGPAQTAQIVLTPRDFVDETRNEMRSFVATDSLGRVDFTVLASRPGGIVLGATAVPEVSRFSPNYGERLKGIAVSVSVARTDAPASIVLSLRQVCAQYFRDTFLYY